MKVIRYTLISEGVSDANLIPIIDWTLKEAVNVELATGVRAEFWRLPHPPRSFAEKVTKAVELFPCDVLFIHRDSDCDPPSRRHDEIRSAVEKASLSGCVLPAVAVVPVRMLEAWFLFDQRAIRRAAGNPNGAVSLDLPGLQRIEERPDPKSDLRKVLQTASELRGRRLKKFNTTTAFSRIVDYIEDFSPLRQLPAYRAFEAAVKRMKNSGWTPGFHG